MRFGKKAAQARSLATSISPKNKDSILEARPAPRLQIRKPKNPNSVEIYFQNLAFHYSYRVLTGPSS